MCIVGVAGRQLLDSIIGEARQIGRGALERGEYGTPGLVRKRDRDLRSAGEGLEQAPLRRGQVLEAIRVHRLPVPRFELAGHTVGCVPALEVTIPETEPIELLPVQAVQIGEVAVQIVGLQEPRLQLRNRYPERIGEPGETGRGAQLTQAGRCDNPAQNKRALDLARNRSGAAVTARDPAKDIVESADRAAEQSARAREQVPFDPLDVRSRRHDQHRALGEIGKVAVEQQRNLAGIRRPGQQRQGHRPILVLRRDGSRRGTGAEPRKLREKSGRGLLRAPELTQAAAAFGLRPRRATARPGVLPAQESQRSASFAPRRASVNAMRKVAPLPSSTSFPQLSHTRTVFLATNFLLLTRTFRLRVPKISSHNADWIQQSNYIRQSVSGASTVVNCRGSNRRQRGGRQ